MDNTNKAIRIAPEGGRPDIVGWGSDLRKRPGIPMELNQETVLSPEHHRPIAVKQRPGPDVNLTLERSSYPPVLGNSHYAKGPSMLVRSYAFRYSEDKIRHWVFLLLADRINMVEGWVEDISRGRMPMLLGRMEFRTTDHLRRVLKQGPKNRQDKLLLASVAGLAFGLGALAYLSVRRKD